MKVKKSLKKIVSGSLMMLALPAMVIAQSTTGSFSDVSASHPNSTAIQYLKDHGVISGYPDGTFKPDQAINRAETLKIILLGSGVQVPASVDLEPFRDVGKTEWYATYLSKAKELQIVGGYPDGTFRPAQTVNLVENLKILLLAQQVDLSTVKVASDPYADAPKDQWYAPYVQYAKDKNLIDADSKNMIHPAQDMTRGKLAEAMYRLMYIKSTGADKFTVPGNTQEQTACMGEGQSLGALVPSNTAVCCAGLEPYLSPSTAIGVRGTCQKPGYTEQQQTSTNIGISDMAFTPATLTIKAGTSVTWTNKDQAIHTVTSDDGKTFASEKLSNNQTFSMTFSNPGSYPYHCEIHPFMKGTITVTQ